MKRAHRWSGEGLFAAALLGLAARGPVIAQEAPLKPFRMEDGTPVMRAEPVVRPPKPLPADPVERGASVPVATPLPRATPPARNGRSSQKRDTPEPGPGSPSIGAKAPPSPEPADPGEIRIAPQTGVIQPEALQLQIADSYYARKMYDMAAPEYQRYVELYPGGSDLPTVYFRLAESYRQTGSLNAAKNSYEMLLARFQQGDFVGPASYRLADLYYQEKNYAGALPLFRKAAVRVKEPAVANAAKFFAARSAEAQGQKIDARTFYEELVEAKENNPFQDASRYSLALLLKDSGRTADALKTLQVVLKQTELPELRAEATVRSGLWMLDLDPPQPVKAAEELKKALEMPGIGRWKEVAQLGLVRVYYDTGKYQQVLDLFAETGDKVSAEGKPELLLRAGNAFRQLGKPEEARKLYEQITKEFPKSPYAKDAAYERLVPFYNSDDPKLIGELDAWLASNADSPRRDQVLLMKAEALFKKQNHKEAAQVYATVAQSRQLPAPLKAEALFRLGYCSMQTRDVDRAVTAFTEFLTANPAHKQAAAALIQRAIAYQSQKNFAAAEKDFSEIIRKFPKAKERELALQQKGLIRGQQNDNTGMLEAFELLIKDYPESLARAQAEYWVGRAAFEAKDYKKAAVHLVESRQRDREQFIERASLPLILSHYYLEDWEAVAREVDLYAKDGKGKVPVDVLRGLSEQLYERKSFVGAEKYLSLLAGRDEAAPRDLLLLGRSRLEQGDFSKAADSLQSYLKTVTEPPTRALGLLDLAQAQIGLKDFPAAQKSVDQVLTLQPEGELNGKGISAAGDVLMAQGRTEEAAKIYASVAALLDDEAVTPQALEKAVEAYRKAGMDAEVKKTLNLLQSRYPEYLQHKHPTP